MSLLTLRFEKSLVAYLQGEIPGVTIIEGHRNGEQAALPRMIVTALSAGGDLIKGSGVAQLEVEIQILMAAGEVGQRMGASDPVERLAALADAVRGALQESALEALENALGEQEPTLGFSGMEYEGHKEGRDEERSLHGVVMIYRAWVALVG